MFHPPRLPPSPPWPPRYANFPPWLKLPQWQSNWVFPPTFRPNHQLLHLYMPFLVQAAYVNGASLAAIVQHLVYSSSDIEENGGFSGVDSTTLEAAYHEVAHIVESSGNGRVAAAHLQNQLSISLEHDMRYPAHRAWRHDYRALQRFRLYADISRKTYSRAIASILFRFFQIYAREILSTCLEAVLLWSHAVCRSHMHTNEKIECLRLLLRYYPEMLSELRAIPHQHAAELWKALASIGGDYCDVHAPIPRPRIDLTGVNPRRRLGRGIFADDDEVNEDWDRVASQVAGRQIFPPRRRLGRSTSPPLDTPAQRYNRALMNDFDDDVGISRPRTAPGNRLIANQAERVIDLANNTIAEAAKLHILAEHN